MPPITSPRRTAFTHTQNPHTLGRPIPGPTATSSLADDNNHHSHNNNPHTQLPSLSRTAPTLTRSTLGSLGQMQPTRAQASTPSSSSAASGSASNAIPSSTESRRVPSKSPSPLNGTSPSNSKMHSPPPPSSSVSRPAPYMVALAGWPEPVFVAEARDMWEKRRQSRPASPTRGLSHLPPLSGFEYRDGVSLPPAAFPKRSEATVKPQSASDKGVRLMSTSPPTASTLSSYDSLIAHTSPGSSVPTAPVLRSRPSSPVSGQSPGRHAVSPSFPTSSARDNPQHSHDGSMSPPSRPSAVPNNLASLAALSLQHSLPGPDRHPHHHPHMQGPGPSAGPASAARANMASRRLGSNFNDPRYSISRESARRALRVTPTWSSPTMPSSGSGTHSGVGAGRGIRGGDSASATPRSKSPATSGENGPARPARSGLLVTHRSTPEVYPPGSLREGSGNSGSTPGKSSGFMSPPPPGNHGNSALNLGMATELYPRDPDSPWMWTAAAANANAAASAAASPAPPRDVYSGNGDRSEGERGAKTLSAGNEGLNGDATAHSPRDRMDVDETQS